MQYIQIEPNMDKVTVTAVSLFNILIAQKCVFVEDKHAGAFREVCRDYHVVAHGGAIELTGRYFYID